MILRDMKSYNGFIFGRALDDDIVQGYRVDATRLARVELHNPTVCYDAESKNKSMTLAGFSSFLGKTNRIWRRNVAKSIPYSRMNGCQYS